MDQTEPLDLDAIEARANAATEGPWDLVPYGSGDPLGDAACREIVGPSEEPVIRQLGCGCCDVGLEGRPDDAAFIAHARTDVPALLAEVRRLRAKLPDVWDEAVYEVRDCGWTHDVGRDDVLDRNPYRQVQP